MECRATAIHCDDCTSLLLPPSCFRWMSLDERSDVGHFCFCRLRVCDIETPPTLTNAPLLFRDFFQSPRKKPRLRACARTPRGMSTVKDSIAAATSETIVETKGCIRKNWATLSRTGETLWRAVQRAVVCVKAQVKRGVPCHNHSL